ncbi:hypothetical protein HZA96_04665 [Candidatus Woesearchaeota archaeon]|nr:hypothetical protein [Candidatus Woesearchaeota archaeon]
MMKCEICKGKIEEIFLKKLIGTYVKDVNGKKHTVCFQCQSKFMNNKDEMVKQI